MMKSIVNCAVYVKALTGLSYLIAEHSGLGPIDILKKVIGKHRFGILFLGHDGPSILSINETERMVKAMNTESVEAVLHKNLVWLNCSEFQRLHQRLGCSMEGDAFILSPQLPEKDIKLVSLPIPSGFNKDKISSKNRSLLDAVLSCNDVYVHDDFQVTFIVTKNPEILEDIHNEIVALSEGQEAN